ncbi:MAG: c-type cytochrome domain-containing protein, partial [Pirellulales bacterium]
MKRQPVSFFAPWMAALAASGLVLAGTSHAPAQSSTDFNRDIRPIFARHCTACHGGVKAAGEVSFVYRAKALAAITPGKPAESELLRRVRSTDPEEVMPKPSHGPRLSERDIATLERWIAEGATWSEPWSFVRPEDPP